MAVLLCAFPVFAQERLSIAAASDLQPAMSRVVSQFEKETGQKVDLSFGSSGNFFAQIQNGAPYDLFFSADAFYPQKLESAGLTQPNSYREYATGKIALWVPRDSKIDVSTGLSVLAGPEVKKIAIADPQHAPYGRAAEAALKKAGVWEQVSPKIVLGENVSQTAQFVQSHSADAGILALSLVLSPAMKDQGRHFEIPQTLYPPLRQAAVILKSAQHKKLAQRFMEFLRKPEIVSLFRQYGFEVSDGSDR